MHRGWLRRLRVEMTREIDAQCVGWGGCTAKAAVPSHFLPFSPLPVAQNVMRGGYV